MGVFQNNQALTHSIYDKGNEKYVPIYENREQMKSLNVKSYIKVSISTVTILKKYYVFMYGTRFVWVCFMFVIFYKVWLKMYYYNVFETQLC